MSKSGEPLIWKNIWEKKGKVASDDSDLAKLIAIDGFDTGAGEFPVESCYHLLKKQDQTIEVLKI